MRRHLVQDVWRWDSGGVAQHTVTAGVGDTGTGSLGVSQQRKEKQGVRQGSQVHGGCSSPPPIQVRSAPWPGAGTRPFQKEQKG